MNRKNTILLAVLINAGLLVVLFVTALTTPEEIANLSTQDVASLKQEIHTPLFGDELDLAVRPPEPVLREPVIESAVMHALPPVVAAVVEPTPHIEMPVSQGREVVVKKGDTLEKIAKASKTTVDEIIKLNHLPSSFLRVGQSLKVPPENVAVAPKALPKELEKPLDYYTVKVGDNPWTIAMKNHIKVDELLKINGLNEDKARKLKAGDRLRIR